MNQEMLLYRQVLARVAIARLWPLRRHSRDGLAARCALRCWLADLKKIREASQ